MLSLQMKIKKVAGLADTKDVTDKENSFIKSLERKLEASNGQVLTLSDAQIDWLDDLHSRHFS